MRAAFIAEAGVVPAIVDHPEPTERPDATIVEVETASIGPTDLAKGTGSWRPFPGAHIVNGEGVGRLADGTRVHFGHSVAPFGALAERTLVPDGWVWPIDDRLADEQAAAIGTAGTGALDALETARVQEGDRVLVLGATGVVGQMGLQIARAMGAGFVAGAGRDAERLDDLRERGLADATAQLGQGDDLGALREIAGDGWDVVLDIIFGPPAAAALKTTARGARMATIGFFAGWSMTLEVADMNGRSLCGVGTNDMTLDERRTAHGRLADMVLAGQLEADVVRYRLEDVAQAWAALSGGPHAKVVIVP